MISPPPPVLTGGRRGSSISTSSMRPLLTIRPASMQCLFITGHADKQCAAECSEEFRESAVVDMEARSRPDIPISADVAFQRSPFYPLFFLSAVRRIPAMSFDPELLAKRAELLTQGINPYPYSFERTHGLKEARAKQNELMGKDLSIAGRLVANRGKGKLIFADIADFDERLQVMFRKDSFSDPVWELIRRNLDLGDWIGVRGPLFLTKMGELTVDA